LAISSGWSLADNYLLVAAVVAIVSVWGSLQFPNRDKPLSRPRGEERTMALGAWKEKRTLTIAIIGFSFIMAEISAGTWVPIALTVSGFSGSAAAFAFGMLWIVVTFGRLIGGFVVEKIGRYRTVLLSTLVTASGILIFMLVEVIALPFVGLVLWGLGMSMGFPMSVAAMSDEPRKAPYRINMIIHRRLYFEHYGGASSGKPWGSDRNLCGLLDSTRSDDSLGNPQLSDKAS
jgi:fucose permease